MVRSTMCTPNSVRYGIKILMNMYHAGVSAYNAAADQFLIFVAV